MTYIGKISDTDLRNYKEIPHPSEFPVFAAYPCQYGGIEFWKCISKDDISSALEHGRKNHVFPVWYVSL